VIVATIPFVFLIWWQRRLNFRLGGNLQCRPGIVWKPFLSSLWQAVDRLTHVQRDGNNVDKINRARIKGKKIEYAKRVLFWDMTLCSLLDVHWRFEVICCLLLQVITVMQVNNPQT
jgi:hypothetical protein